VALASLATPVLADDADMAIDPAQPDVTLLSLPTTMPLPSGHGAFRVTHRFTRPLSDGSFGDLVQDAFGLDSSAEVGLELRWGIVRNLQAGVYRLSDRTIDLFAQHTLIRQDKHPLGLALQGSVEGLNNFREDYSPHVSVILSRALGERGSLYVEPGWVGNTHLGLSQAGVDESSVVLGLGARVNVHGGLYLVGEAEPVIAGYRGIKTGGGDSAPFLSFGIEEMVGGHLFQINFSNATGTTPAGVARAQDNRVADWYVGFCISRKFY
jgi:hypothetical protein